ncbi:hypothetical protein ACQPW3_17810 [Actinosynnema sp. CA-248983]
MSETELVRLLRERADIPDDGRRTRVAGVRAKVRRSRWRQAGAVTVAAAVVFAGVLYGLPGGQSADPADSPADPPPVYLDGYKYTHSAFATVPERQARLTYTPKNENFLFYASCSIGEQRSVGIRMTVNGKVWYDGVCDRIGTPIPPPRDAWTAFGIRFGQEIRVEATLTDPAPEAGRWGFRVGEGLSLADYSFPPRPPELPALPRVAPQDVLARSNPEHPAGQASVTFEWSATEGLELDLNSPGRVQVFVNDVRVLDAVFWTWGPNSASTAPVSEWPRLHGLDLKPGQEVTLVVVPERTSGEWRVTRWPDRPR